MYDLALTLDERRAIDFIGDRYGHGNDLFYALVDSEWYCENYDSLDPWGDKGVVVFRMPEHVGWQINEIGEECQYRWDCFSPEFAKKMTEFCKQII